MTLQQTLSDIITNLPDWSKQPLNEAQTSQAIVLRVIQVLGYDIWNPFEVIPEETADSGNKPDFMIAIDNKDRFVIEVKRLGRDLDNKAKIQAVNYANNKAIRWAVLTDGSSWLLFDSFMQKPAQDRLILTLSLRKQSVQVLANALGRLLHVDVWSRDDVHTYIDQTARDIRDNLRLSAQLEPLAETLRTFMDEMTIREPEKGIELAVGLGKWSEEDQKLIEENRALFHSLISDEEPDPDSKPIVSPRSPAARGLAETLREGIEHIINQQPSVKNSDTEVVVDGQRLTVRSWRDVYAGIAEAYILLGKSEILETKVQTYESTEERRKRSGEAYPPHEYRQLSNGRYIFVRASENDKKSKDLLQGLDAPSGIIKFTDRGKK